MPTKKPIKLIGTLSLAAKLGVHPMSIPRLVKKNPDFPRPKLMFGKNQWDEDKVNVYLAKLMKS